jgi:Mn2+/Fe2+ NRAMP family transporter
MAAVTSTTAPPTTLVGALAHLGPGIILASSIVGSGELIATTTVGAEAGFGLLWLIIFGCVIKVAAQVEIGRNALAWGRTPLDAFDRVPGPRAAGRGWLWWGWVVMTVLIVVQQAGILAGVAQTLAGGLPLTAAGRAWNVAHDEAASLRVAEAAARRRGEGDAAALHERLDEVVAAEAGLAMPVDETAWMVIIGLATAALLMIGRYGLIEKVSVALVGTFTVVTLVALVMLQSDPAWAVSAREVARGLVPGVPPATGGRSPLATGLATFGIIGVGASELMVYPYWCLEKGYGRAVGPRDESAAWAERARGWLRVMQLDAWASMVVYTVVTVCFYLLGAATLGRLGLRPEGSEMVRTLGAMYAPVFGAWASLVWLVGAFAALYSTFFVAAAGNSRLATDGLILAGWIPGDDASRTRWTLRVSAAWALLAVVLAVTIRAPVAMVLASGAAQAIMLAGLAVAVLWFRYGEMEPRLTPSRGWDTLLWVSAAGFVVVGFWTVWQHLAPVWWQLAGTR